MVAWVDVGDVDIPDETVHERHSRAWNVLKGVVSEQRTDYYEIVAQSIQRMFVKRGYKYHSNDVVDNR